MTELLEYNGPIFMAHDFQIQPPNNYKISVIYRMGSEF